MKYAERLLENFLWNSRYFILLPVFVGLLLAFGLFVLATIDAILLVARLVEYVDVTLTEEARVALRIDTISQAIGALDVYLIAALMLLFSLGLYELFVNKIDAIEDSEFAARLLLFKSFDDFKDRLASVVVVVLIVKFFQQALELKYTSVLDILLLALGIALLGIALYFIGRGKPSKSG
jgi:uncharacterized membrane protein YqhA